MKIAVVVFGSLFASLWLTALVMYGRPPTVLAHVVMAALAVPAWSVARDRFGSVTAPRERDSS